MSEVKGPKVTCSCRTCPSLCGFRTRNPDAICQQCKAGHHRPPGGKDRRGF